MVGELKRRKESQASGAALEKYYAATWNKNSIEAY
jgi:hypothetical protein